MDREETKRIIQEELKALRVKPHAELMQMIEAEPIAGRRVGASGACYQVEVQAFWDDKPNGNIRVMGSIDDGGPRAFAPLAADFIKSPSNEFIGE
jgi:hypothetical protein